MADTGHILHVDVGYTLYVLHRLSEPPEKGKAAFFKNERRQREGQTQLGSLAEVS